MTLFLKLFLLILLFNPGSLWGERAPTYLDSNMLIFGNGGGFTIKPLDMNGQPIPGYSTDAISPTINIINYKGLHVNGNVVMIDPSVEYASRNITTFINYKLSDRTDKIDYNVLVASNYETSYMAINNSSISAFTPQSVLGGDDLLVDLPTTLYIQRNGGPTWLGTTDYTRSSSTPSPSVFLYSANHAVGINTDSPTKNLYVNGNIHIDGYILGKVGLATYREKDGAKTLPEDDGDTPNWDLFDSDMVIEKFDIDMGPDSVTHSIMAIGMGSYVGKYNKVSQRLQLYSCVSAFDEDCTIIATSGISSFDLSSEQLNVALTSSIAYTIDPNVSKYYKIHLKALHRKHSNGSMGGPSHLPDSDQGSIAIIGLPSKKVQGTYSQLDQLPVLNYDVDVFGASIERANDTFITNHKLHFENQSEIRVSPVGDLYFLKGGGSGFAAIRTRYMHATGQIRNLSSVIELVSSGNASYDYMLKIGPLPKQLRFGASFESEAAISHNIQTFDEASPSNSDLTLYSPLNFSDSTLVVNQSGDIGINGDPDPNVKLKVHGDIVATGVISGKYGIIDDNNTQQTVSVALLPGIRWDILVIASVALENPGTTIGSTHIKLSEGEVLIGSSGKARYKFSRENQWYTFSNILQHKTSKLEANTTFSARLVCQNPVCSNEGQIIILATPAGDE